MNDTDTIATQAAEIAQLRKERNDYAEEARNAGEYVREIGVLLGCADGDDTPKDRIAQLRETVATLTRERDEAVEKFRKAEEWNSVTKLQIGNLQGVVSDQETDIETMMKERDAAITARDEAREELGLMRKESAEWAHESRALASQLDAAHARITDLVASWNQEHDEHVKANVRVRELEEKLNEADNCIREFAKSSL